MLSMPHFSSKRQNAAWRECGRFEMAGREVIPDGHPFANKEIQVRFAVRKAPGPFCRRKRSLPRPRCNHGGFRVG